METFAVDKSFYEIGTPELKDIWDSDLDNSMHEVLRLNPAAHTHHTQAASDLLPVEWNFLERELPVVLHDRLMTDAALGSITTRPIKNEHSYSLSSDGDSNPHSPTNSHCGATQLDDMDVDCFPSINPASVKLPPEDEEDVDVKDEPFSETDSVHSSCPSSPQEDEEYLNGPCENVDVDEYFADIDNIRKTLKQKPITTNYILSATTPQTLLQLDMLGHLTTTSPSNSFHLPPTPPSCSSSEEGDESTTSIAATNNTTTLSVTSSPASAIQLSQQQMIITSGGNIVRKQQMTPGTTRVVLATSGSSRQPIHTPLISNQPKGSTGSLMLTEEEKRTLLAEGYPVPTRLPLTKAEEKSLKKIRRKIKNKISAQESRRKKKEYMDQLERKVDILVAENNDYKKKLDSLENSNTTLLNQLAKLQAIVARSHPQLIKK